MQNFVFDQTAIKFEATGDGSIPVFWGHGWGQSHQAFLPMISSLQKSGRHCLIDFPGFGESDSPKRVWTTADYADACAALIRTQTDQKILWVGHSFGCRVGLQLAARHPDLVEGLFLIAAAGLPRKRPFHQKLYLKSRIALFKGFKRCMGAEWARKKFGSADYKNTSGLLRSIFVTVVNENLSDEARKISCPVTLVYGAQDTETPPEIGQRLAALIPNSNLVVLDGQDHYSVLDTGRHQTLHLLHNFIKQHAA